MADITPATHPAPVRTARHEQVRLPSIERWAGLLAAVLLAPDDPATLGAWAGIAHASEPTLRAWCYLVGVRPRASLVLARLLRAFYLSRREHCSPRDLLVGSDRRTVDRLLSNARVKEDCCIEALLDAQTLVEDARLVAAIKRAVEGVDLSL